MLDGVQAQRVHIRGIQVPAEPFFGLADDFGIGHVDIHAHKEVEIAVFGVCFRSPFLAGESIDIALLLGILIPVSAREMPVIPCEAAVFSPAPREGKL